jgi:TIR domain
MGRVFVSFRNGDEPFGALLIQLMLGEHIGPQNVFRSTDSIAPGEDYVESLIAAVHRCEVMLAVVGPRWMSVADADGRPRILDPNDWVARELGMAFADRKRVIPVLLGGAVMPAPTELPPGIVNLSRCQYRRLEHRQFGANMALLISDVQTVLADDGPSGPISPGHRVAIRPSRAYDRLSR